MSHRGATDNLMLSTLVKWRAKICNLVVADLLTDLEGAYDTCSHKGMDEARDRMADGGEDIRRDSTPTQSSQTIHLR